MSTPNQTNQINIAKLASFATLLVIIGLTGVLFYRVMSSFLLPLFLAALLVVIFGPAFDWWLKRLGNRRKTAAAITCLFIVFTILFPLVWVIIMAVNEGIDLVARDWSGAATQLAGFREKVGLELPLGSEIERARLSVEDLAISNDPTPDEIASLHRRIEKLDHLLNQIFEQLPRTTVESHDTSEQSITKIGPAANQLVELKAVSTVLRQAIEEVGLERAISDDQAHTIRELIGRLNVRYSRFRQEMLGGTLRAWLVELANPDAAKLRTWQKGIGDYIQHWLLSVTGRTTAVVGQLVVGTFIMLFSLFYFFLDGSGMLKTIMRLSPIEDRYEERLLTEFTNVSRAVVVATLLSAIVQGILAGIGYFVSGAGPWFLLVALTTILAMVPFVGAAAVWLPVSLWLAFVEQRFVAGIGLAIYGALVVSLSDNVIKPYVLHGRSKIHPLLGLLSVLGGVKAMGPIGILVGPMLVAFLQAMLTILRQEMDSMDSTRVRPGAT